MVLSEKTENTIKELFKDDKEMMARLLLPDLDAIRSLTTDINIDYTDVLEALDPENEIKKQELIKKAKKKKLYFDMLEELLNEKTDENVKK